MEICEPRFDSVAVAATAAAPTTSAAAAVTTAPATSAATTTAPTTSTAAASVTTPTSSAAVPTTSASAAWAFFTGFGFVDGQSSALELGVVHALNRLLDPFGHFHEGEAARAARFPIHDDLGFDDRAELAEGFQQVFVGRAEWQVADVQILDAHA